MRELEGLIRDTDQRIREAFEETFAAAAKNFEEVVEQLFPGGRGRLRLVREDAGPRARARRRRGPRARRDAEATRRSRPREAEEAGPDDGMGVEIEITPAGKATKRLTLLSGGEKSLTALAFLFAVFLARPCPFYILDEVEAALDDLNIDRFLRLLRRFSDRAQFIVVTHQKRTMEAADCLYGVSMAGNGVSKVVSRRLPPSPQSRRRPGFAALFSRPARCARWPRSSAPAVMCSTTAPAIRRAWAGTLTYDLARPARCTGSTPTAPSHEMLDSVVTISNGIAWTPDGGTVFYVTRRRASTPSTSTPTVWLSNRRTAVSVDVPAGAVPDGLTLDARGRHG